MRNLAHRATLAITALASTLAGCTVLVTSEPAKETSHGQVYYLPRPVIVVTPKPDGTAEVAVEYLPDPTKQYVIRTTALVSQYSLDVKTKNGMLESVALTSDATAVAKAAVDASAAVADKAFQAKLKLQEDAAKAQLDSANKEKDLRKAVALAEVKLRALQSLAQDPNNGIKPDHIVEAKLDLAKAQAELAAFLGRSTDEIGLPAADGSFDRPELDPSTRVTEMAPGPLLFNVDTATGTLTADDQKMFATVTIDKPKPKADRPVLETFGVTSVVRKAGESAEFTLRFSGPIGLVANLEGGVLIGPAPGTTQVPLAQSGLSFEPKETAIKVTVPVALRDGRYKIVLPLEPPGMDPGLVDTEFELFTTTQ